MNEIEQITGGRTAAAPRRRAWRRLALAAALAAVGPALAACGGGGGGGGSAPKQPAGVKVAPTLAQSRGAKGTVTLCAGKDTSGGIAKAIAQFNAKYASQGLKAKLIEFPASADEQRSAFVQRQQAKSSECDVFQSDIIWTAEFVSQKWLMDMTPYVQSRQSEFLPATLAPMRYGGRYWGVPQVTGAGLLYYRTDQVKAPPATWQALYADAKANSGIVYQGALYEGLTCDFLELAYAAGGQVLSPDGKKAVIDSPQNLKALQLMVDGVKNGTAANGVTTYMEEEARRYWESGKATFMRNWGYAYALGEKAPKIKGKFAVAPLPPFQGGGRGGILGGASPVISTFSKNPKGAVLFIDFFTSPAIIKQNAVEFALPPVLKATYDDRDVKKAIPFSAQLEQAVEQAKPRPVSPVYPQISEAIYNNVNAALAGHASPADALKTAQAQIDKALATF